MVNRGRAIWGPAVLIVVGVAIFASRHSLVGHSEGMVHELEQKIQQASAWDVKSAGEAKTIVKEVVVEKIREVPVAAIEPLPSSPPTELLTMADPEALGSGMRAVPAFFSAALQARIAKRTLVMPDEGKGAATKLFYSLLDLSNLGKFVHFKKQSDACKGGGRCGEEAAPKFLRETLQHHPHRSEYLSQLHTEVHMAAKWWDYAGLIVRGMNGPGNYVAVVNNAGPKGLGIRQSWFAEQIPGLMNPGEPSYICCGITEPAVIRPYHTIMEAGNTLYHLGAFIQLFKEPNDKTKYSQQLTEIECDPEGREGPNCLPFEALVLVFARRVAYYNGMIPMLAWVNEMRFVLGYEPVHIVNAKGALEVAHTVAPATTVPPGKGWPGYKMMEFARDSSLPHIFHGSAPKGPFLENADAKFITVEPWNGGWNNIRMAFEGAIIFAYLMNRTLVLPDPYPMYRLGPKPLHFSDMMNITRMLTKVHMVTRKEWIEWHDRHRNSIKKVDPHFSKRTKHAPGQQSSILNNQFRLVEEVGSVTNPPIPGAHDVVFCFPSCPKPEPADFLLFKCGRRKYGLEHPIFSGNTIHFNQNLLTHWSANFWFEDPGLRYHVAKLIREITYVDPVYTAAKKIIAQLGGSQSYSALHARRTELQFTEAKSPADVIARHMAPVYNRAEKLYIVTDEPDPNWFGPLREEHHPMLFLKDFPDAKKEPFYLWGPIESVVGAHARLFIGTEFSTFTSNIYKLRGYNGLRDRFRFISWSTPWPELPPYAFADSTFCHRIWSREYQHSWAGLGHGDTLAQEYGIE